MKISEVKEGDKFGRLIIIKLLGSRKIGKNYKYFALCKCDCNGNIKEYRLQSLCDNSNRRTRSCGCLNQENRKRTGNKSNSWKGFGEISSRHWGSIKFCAKKRNITFDYTIENAWQLYLNQDKKCAISGIPINFTEHRGEYCGLRHKTASFDRIDSLKGYIEGNVWWIHKDINTMKWDFSMSRFLELCNLVVENENRD